MKSCRTAIDHAGESSGGFFANLKVRYLVTPHRRLVPPKRSAHTHLRARAWQVGTNSSKPGHVKCGSQQQWFARDSTVVRWPPRGVKRVSSCFVLRCQLQALSVPVLCGRRGGRVACGTWSSRAWTERQPPTAETLLRDLSPRFGSAF